MTRTLSFICILLISVLAQGQNYCLAIRGNGELAPAHWGGMAQIIETMGLPQRQAGGSSASISMFLLDAIATNPLVHSADPATQKQVASLLVKSLHGYLLYLAQTKQFTDMQNLFLEGKQLSQSVFAKDIKKTLEDIKNSNFSESLAKIKETLKTGLELGLINSDLMGTLNSLASAAQSSQSTSQQKLEAIAQLKFSLSEFYNTLRVFGAFNAQSDANLFFRPGVVSFSGLANQLGRIANFYAQNKVATQSKDAMKKFVSSCAPFAKNKTWNELINARPLCQELLQNAINAYNTKEDLKNNFAQLPIGTSIISYPTTAVLADRAYTQTHTAMQEYWKKMDASFGNSFVIQHPEDIYFGYWGKDVDQIKMPQSDEKSRRFMSLGQANWISALSKSPAEPGLSPLLEFSAKGKNYISAGGWSDLHPTIILKASGCEHVIYLTRRGGESLFAQGVAKRLLGYDRSWQYLKPAPTEDSDDKDIGQHNAILNNTGDVSDLTSEWSNLYNVANPNSSFEQSLKAADAVLCTDWNDYDIKQGPTAMIDNAYKSSYYVSQGSPLNDIIPLNKRINTQEKTTEDFFKNVGCFPQNEDTP